MEIVVLDYFVQKTNEDKDMAGTMGHEWFSTIPTLLKSVYNGAGLCVLHIIKVVEADRTPLIMSPLQIC